MDTLQPCTVAITTTFQVSFGQNINNTVGQIEYIGQGSTSDIFLIISIAVGGVVLLVVTFVLIIVKAMYCQYTRSHQSSSYDNADHDDDKIVMNDNIVYHKSDGISEPRNLNSRNLTEESQSPPPTEITDHSYEEFSDEETASVKKKEPKAHDYVNVSKKRTGADGYYFVGIESFLKEDNNIEQTSIGDQQCKFKIHEEQ